MHASQIQHQEAKTIDDLSRVGQRLMRTLWLEGIVLDVRDLPVPSFSHREARVRVTLAGICGTDLALRGGYAAFAGIPGHEFVGVVNSVGETEDEDWIGQRVVGEINIGCGECRSCEAGVQAHCEDRQAVGIHVRNGAFAEYLTLPVANLHRVPDRVSDEAAVFSEPLAAAARIPEQVEVTSDTRALVMGAGRLGQLVARVLDVAGAEVVACCRRERPAALLDAAGISSIRPADVDDRAYDLVVDCTGQPSGLSSALAAVRAQGTLVLKSTYMAEVEADLRRVVVDEVQIVGSRCGPFTAALELLARCQVDPTPLIEATYPLSEAEAAFEHAARPGTMKILLDPTR